MEINRPYQSNSKKDDNAASLRQAISWEDCNFTANAL
jgi:hypothetical protein